MMARRRLMVAASRGWPVRGCMCARREPAVTSATAAFFRAHHYRAFATYKHTGRKLEAQALSAERQAAELLEVSADATETQIKAAFRKMALRHHPDITASTASGGSSSGAESETKMAELTAAVDMLVGSDLSKRVGAGGSWGKLALHCEVYSTAQLRRSYDVRAVRLAYDEEFHDMEDDDDGEAEGDEASQHAGEGGAGAEAEAAAAARPEDGALAARDLREWVIASHPYDSGADLKRQLQQAYRLCRLGPPR